MAIASRPAPARRAPEVLVCAAAGFTTLLDSSVLSIGMPALRSALNAEVAQVQWILAAYSLTFGLALVPAGRLGDVYGRRRLLLAGMGLFTALLMLPVVAYVPRSVAGASIAGASLSVAVFLWWEKRFATRFGDPVLIPALTHSGGYVLGTLIALFWFGAVLSVNTVVSLYLIEGLGYPPLQAAAVMSAGSMAMAIASAAGWRIVARFGRLSAAAAVLIELAVIAG